MKMLLPLSNLKGDLNKRIQSVKFKRSEIGCGLKAQAIKPWSQLFFLGQQLGAAAVLVGARRCQKPPIAGCVSPLETDRNTFGRLPPRYIENVS